MFNERVDRRYTSSVKHEAGVSEAESEQAIMLSVADMEFRAPENVIDKMVDAANHGIYGYTGIYDDYTSAVQTWMKRQYDWDVHQDWIVYCPRVSQAIALLIQNHTKKGDQILIQTPLYGPLREAIEVNDREVVSNPLKLTEYGYEIDFVDLENKLASEVKMMLFCSPHNPIGRVWTKDELTQVAELCEKYDVLLISDEVHADFAFSKPHMSIQQVAPSMENLVVCTSPAKTFNLPGLFITNIIIPEEGLRSSFMKALHQAGINNPAYFSVPALKEAYTNSDEWLKQLKEVIQDNYTYVQETFHELFPELNIPPIDGTYLMWIDLRPLNLSESALYQLFTKEAKVVLSFGSSFGKDGEGFIRLNLATPKSVLKEAMERIELVFQKDK